MKLWFKYLAGIAFGALLFWVSPPSLFESGAAFFLAAEVALKIGFYVLELLLLVNIPLAVVKLYEEKRFWGLSLKSLAFFALSLLAAALLGLAAALLVLPIRLPLLSDIAAPSAQGFGKGFLELFPTNISELLLRSGEQPLPALLLSLCIGLAMAHDPIAAKPFTNILDSFSRILHTINVFITEIAGALLIPISARAFYLMAASLEQGIYGPFLLYLGSACMGLLLFVLPLALFALGGKKNPLPLLYSSLPAALAAMSSGSPRFALGTIIRQSRENQGIKRRYNAVFLPSGLFAGRIGTAFIAAFSFVAVLSSYSQLTISLPRLLLVAVLIPLATLAVSSSLSSGPITVITLACGLFGRGFENGYLVIVPVAFVLAMMAGFLDSLWIGAAQALVARGSLRIEPKAPRNFI
ncbi:MAG: cation:dicarboxylase symporter family transporter [Spirochaetia bacterium]|jgi:Na+/H+-dicarboxylate symporter|nr:cation:dicarboxylase symporter family transporter [Spirochaetia bacterium]